MQTSTHELVQGAIALIDELKEVGTFPIEINNQQNTELFKERIQKHITNIRLVTSTPEQKVSLLLEQFALQPKNVINILEELIALNQKEAILKGLQHREYQDGFSYLYILYDAEDQEKWHEKFLEECFEHIHRDLLITPMGFLQNVHYQESAVEWDNFYKIIEHIEPIFEKFSIDNQDRALTLVSSSDFPSRHQKKFKALTKKHFKQWFWHKCTFLFRKRKKS